MLGIKWTRSDYQRQIGESWLSHMKFQLFGESNFFTSIILVLIFIGVAFWFSVLFIAGHFIRKYW